MWTEHWGRGREEEKGERTLKHSSDHSGSKVSGMADVLCLSFHGNNLSGLGMRTRAKVVCGLWNLRVTDVGILRNGVVVD